MLAQDCIMQLGNGGAGIIIFGVLSGNPKFWAQKLSILIFPNLNVLIVFIRGLWLYSVYCHSTVCYSRCGDALVVWPLIPWLIHKLAGGFPKFIRAAWAGTSRVVGILTAWSTQMRWLGAMNRRISTYENLLESAALLLPVSELLRQHISKGMLCKIVLLIPPVLCCWPLLPSVVKR